MPKATKKEIERILIKMEEKYSSIVWFTRRSEDNLLVLTEEGVEENKLIFDKMDKIQSLYPTEISDLLEDEDNWEHGFNSGMLAGIRYVLTLMEMGEDQAEEWFPELDS